MPGEQASQDFSTLRFDRGCEVAPDGEMAQRHATIGLVLYEARTLTNRRRWHHTVAPKGRSEDLRISRLRKFGECFRRGARQCVEGIGLASLIEHIVKERSEGRSRKLGCGVSHHLHDAFKINLGSNRVSDSVQCLKRPRFLDERLGFLA